MPIVTPAESIQILSTLEAPNQSFRQTLQHFNTHWPLNKGAQFSAACYILLALEEGYLKSAVSRLHALQILHSLSKTQSSKINPFLPFLIQATQDSNRPYLERVFIQQLLVGGVHLDHQASVAVQDLQKIPLGRSPLLPPEDLWQAFSHRSKEEGASPEGAEPLSAHASQAQIDANGQLQPPYIHHQQEMMEVQPGEVPWQHMQLPHLLRWDATMAQNLTSLKELQTLLKSALLRPLLPSQQQQVLRELELDRRLVVSLDLARDAVPQLVEKNPVIAYEVLVRLIQLGCGDEYLPSLVGMEVSVHSMEVINRLSTAASLPSQFVHLYISNCIRSCQAAQDDKYMQLRRVRLVCVFLQSLIRNNIINVQDLSFEAQAFCIEFSRVREAAALFRLLKQLENGEPS